MMTCRQVAEMWQSFKALPINTTLYCPTSTRQPLQIPSLTGEVIYVYKTETRGRKSSHGHQRVEKGTPGWLKMSQSRWLVTDKALSQCISGCSVLHSYPSGLRSIAAPGKGIPMLKHQHQPCMHLNPKDTHYPSRSSS